MSTIAILTAAGTGSRTHQDIPKREYLVNRENIGQEFIYNGIKAVKKDYSSDDIDFNSVKEEVNRFWVLLKLAFQLKKYANY